MTQYTPPPGQPPYGQPPPGQPMMYGQPTPSPGLAIGSLITGILSILSCCMWFISIPLGLCGVILGFVAKGKVARGQASGSGMATAGIITGGIGLLLSIALLLIGIFGGPELERRLKVWESQQRQQMQQQQQQQQQQQDDTP